MIEKVRIDDHFSYLTGSEDPLSSEVAILDYGGRKWLYDVGNNREVLSYLTEEYNAVISHFHIDHCSNVTELKINNLFVSEYTYRHLKQGRIVKEKEEYFPFTIFDISSSHCKGSLALKVEDKYLLLADGLYCSKQGYNVQLLKKQIEIIEKTKVEYLFIAHSENPLIKKAEGLSFLRGIYQERRKDSPYSVINQ
ncbi:MAG: hypothetical protein ACI4WG_06730 [Erysipelotrichaceae bacterium]